MSSSSPKYPWAITTRYSTVQYESLNIVARATNTSPADILRNMIDFKIVPLAAKHGYRRYVSKQVSETAVAGIVPKSLCRLTRSQLLALIDFAIQGWSPDELAELYEIGSKGVKDLVENVNQTDLLKLQKVLKKTVKKEAA